VTKVSGNHNILVIWVVFLGPGASGTRAKFATKLSSDSGYGIADILGARLLLSLRECATHPIIGSDYSTWVDTSYM
jgi:hypothetical protein